MKFSRHTTSWFSLLSTFLAVLPSPDAVALKDLRLMPRAYVTRRKRYVQILINVTNACLLAWARMAEHARDLVPLLRRRSWTCRLINLFSGKYLGAWRTPQPPELTPWGKRWSRDRSGPHLTRSRVECCSRQVEATWIVDGVCRSRRVENLNLDGGGGVSEGSLAHRYELLHCKMQGQRLL